MLHSLKQSGLIHKSIWESDEGGLCHVQCFVTFLTHLVVVTTLLNKRRYLHMHKQSSEGLHGLATFRRKMRAEWIGKTKDNILVQMRECLLGLW